MRSNYQLRAQLYLRAAELTIRDDLKEGLVDAALDLIGNPCYTDGDLPVRYTLDYAESIILDFVADGPQRVKDLDYKLRQLGISDATARRAKNELSKNHIIKEWSEGAGVQHKWYIELAKEDA